jgi:hypothetical protein
MYHHQKPWVLFSFSVSRAVKFKNLFHSADQQQKKKHGFY